MGVQAKDGHRKASEVSFGGKRLQSKKGIDFDEIFSPVVKIMSIRVVMGLVTSLHLELE